MIADWGFDFARIPMSYRCLTTPDHPFTLGEAGMAKIDKVVEYGDRHGVHVNLNLHRAPGFCINDDELEPFGWLDDDGIAVDYFCAMWCDLARRYKGIPSEKLTFNFINEPDEKPRIGPNLTRPRYCQVMKRLIREVHEVDPDRHCVFDGWRASVETLPELAGIPNTSFSFHGYYPHELTHHAVGGWRAECPVPTWPEHGVENTYWDRNALEVYIRKWCDFAKEFSAPIHMGECGCGRFTPHKVLLAWAEDLFSLCREYGVGYAYWRVYGGDFGVLKRIPNPGMPLTRKIGDFYLDEELLKILQKN